MKKFVGVDLHKQRIVVCVVNQARQVLTSARFTNAESIKLAAWLKALGSFDLVLEATASYEWFVKLVEPLAGRVLLAHPRKMRIIAESTRKSDKVDARVLAEFLALDMIPPAHRPTPRQRAHRKLVRRRVYVRARQTSIKNRIRHVAAEYNADRKELFTSEGLKYLRGLKLDPVDRWLVQRLLRELKLYRDEAEGCRSAAGGLRPHSAGRRSGPPCAAEFDSGRRTGDARGVPGGGRRAGAFRLAEEADQLRRPGARTARVGRQAPRPGHHAQRLADSARVLHQAAWQLVRRSSPWRLTFERLALRRGKKKAITAIARRLLCLMLAVIRSGRPYQERPPATPATPSAA
ncbi:MAG: transposase [Phycisphaerales bacterium]|nr:transposase [Phycisphaerales bacterium]